MSDRSELKILSLNVWGLAFISKLRAPRLAAIANYLRGADYDVVCLQEIWIHEEFAQVRDDVQGVLPYSRFYHTGALGSGLAVFSRLPFLEAHALPYNLSGRPSEVIAGDFFVNKAAARAVLEHPALGPIEVWNTHMHAAGEGGPETRQTHRVTQAWQLATEVRGSAARGHWVFVMGDFNSQPFSLPISLLRTYGGLNDSFLETHPHANDPAPVGLQAATALTTLGMTCDSPLNSWSQGKPIPAGIAAQGGKRLDYIFYRGPETGPRVHCAESKVVLDGLVPGESFSYSDHFGLTSTFVIEPAGEGSREPATPKTHYSATAPLLSLDAEDSAAPPSPTSAYELSRAHSSGATASAIRAAVTNIRSYSREAAALGTKLTLLVPLAIIVALGLTIGSAWQPKAWLQPIFTLVAFVAGAAGATFLYVGWLWTRWERGYLDEFVSEMELELAVLHRRGGD
ncbi:phospholipase C type enzyme [Vanrija albida]|uniref:Phospholipase C type enzyme n=1 Tax=Vanrija albida TaxID=181172 RepID=A0ABR3Q796_9TREE